MNLIKIKGFYTNIRVFSNNKEVILLNWLCKVL